MITDFDRRGHWSDSSFGFWLNAILLLRCGPTRSRTFHLQGLPFVLHTFQQLVRVCTVHIRQAKRSTFRCTGKHFSGQLFKINDTWTNGSLPSDVFPVAVFNSTERYVWSDVCWIATNGEEGLLRLSKTANSHEDALTEFVLADVWTLYLQDTNYIHSSWANVASNGTFMLKRLVSCESTLPEVR